jgi:hypothetical protein
MTSLSPAIGIPLLFILVFAAGVLVFVHGGTKR